MIVHLHTFKGVASTGAKSYQRHYRQPIRSHLDLPLKNSSQDNKAFILHSENFQQIVHTKIDEMFGTIQELDFANNQK